ncbi:hypothetical protein AB5N19_03223 [Seiridium cardinale]|uniref:Uncharacterized protein n=1 Tax=Seiridium cardinale TaxID=138064 RepID=A0ABR2XGI2_9PEZI
MYKSLATLALLAAALVQAVPAPIDAADVELDARDFELEDRDLEAARAVLDFELEARDFELDEREVDARATKTLNGLADFEKVDTSAAGLNQIGKYGGLFWSGIGAVNAGTGSKILGIQPVSPKNAAIYGTLTSAITTKPILTAQFSGSQTTSFSIDSLYFGCVGQIAILPTRCVVALAGYDSTNKLIAFQKLLFNPASGIKVTASMQYAKLNNQFKGLSYVRLASTYSGINLLGSTLFDNIKYSIVETV